LDMKIISFLVAAIFASQALAYTGILPSSSSSTSSRISDGRKGRLPSGNTSLRRLLQIDTRNPFGVISDRWSNSFSEENWGHSASTGAPVAGIRCSDKYCDNKRLLFYSQAPANVTATKRGPWITDNPGTAHGSVDPEYIDQFGSYDCTDVIPNGYITALQCQDDYCDNIRFTCQSAQGVTIDSSRTQTSTFSEEGSASFTCSFGYVLTGLACSGHYCDNLHVTCSQYRYQGTSVVINSIQGVYRYLGVGDTEVVASRELSSALSGARSSNSESSWEVSNTVNVGVSGSIFSASAEVTATVSNSYQTEVSRAVENTEAEMSQWTRSVSAINDCGLNTAVVYQFGYNVRDSSNESSTIRVPRFVCSQQHLPSPKCTPADCGNVHAITIQGIAPGCQCCKVGSASALAGGPVCP
jgi:hypothetical protein